MTVCRMTESETRTLSCGGAGRYTGVPRPAGALNASRSGYSPLLRADFNGVVLMEDVEPLSGVHAVPLVMGRQPLRQATLVDPVPLWNTDDRPRQRTRPVIYRRHGHAL